MTSGADELHFFYDAQNRPAVVVYNGTAYAYVKSLQGDVIALLDGTGNVVVSYVYDAWGMPIGKSGTLTETLGTLNPFRYRGYVFDEETGLYYLRSRYYNPRWGRFVNADCIYSANCFAYCENAPIAFFDEDGMKMSLKIGFDDCDFVTRLMLGGAGGGFSYSGRCEDIWSGASIRRAALAYEERWSNSPYNINVETYKPNLTPPATQAEPALYRPYIRQAVRRIVAGRAKRTTDGKFIDPNTGKKIIGKYHFGHKSGVEFWRMLRYAIEHKMTQSEFNDFCNNPDYYQIEDPMSNMSHIFECREAYDETEFMHRIN